MPERLACPGCEVLATVDSNDPCWCCGEPMVPWTQFRNPAASWFSNPILAAIAGEIP